MKKILFMFIIIFCCVGCGNKLTCSYEEVYEDVEVINKIVLNFKDNKYKKIDKMLFKDKESAEKYFLDISDYIEEYNLKLKNNIIESVMEDDL